MLLPAMTRNPPLPLAFGRYILRERIAAGGMAEVYRAGMPGFGGFERSVAIKRMFRHLADDASFVAMLADEAGISSQLSHPNIASVLDFGREGEDWFLAYELVDGVDLFRLLQRQFETGRDLSISLAIFIVAELASALDFAHARRAPDGSPLQIIHRDVSPQNVLIGYQGEVKLTDFGIAKAAARRTQTEVGQIKGKVYYMSPEAARGERLDHRADLFSAGILLFELLCTRPLYDVPDPRRLLEVVSRGEVRWPADKAARVPAPLLAVANRALARQPDARYQTGRELREALLRVADECNARADRDELGAWVRRLFGVSDDRPLRPDGTEVDADADHWSSLATESLLAQPRTAPERPQARVSAALPRPAGRPLASAEAERRAESPAKSAQALPDFDGEGATALLDTDEVQRRLQAAEPPPLPTTAAAMPTAARSVDPELATSDIPPPIPRQASPLPARSKRPSLLQIHPVTPAPTDPPIGLGGGSRPSGPVRATAPRTAQEAPAPASGSAAPLASVATAETVGLARVARADEAPPALPVLAVPPSIQVRPGLQRRSGVSSAAAPSNTEGSTRSVPAMADEERAAAAPKRAQAAPAALSLALASTSSGRAGASATLDPDAAPASWSLIAVTLAVWSAVLVLAAYATLLLVR